MVLPWLPTAPLLNLQLVPHRLTSSLAR